MKSVCFIQQEIVKLLPLRLIIGAVAKEFDWLKMGALLPGHRPSTKNCDPLKLQKKHKYTLNLIDVTNPYFHISTSRFLDDFSPPSSR